MRRSACVVAIALAGPGLAAPMEDVCLERGTWDAETCLCMQGVADQTLEADTQEMAARYFARKITSQEIAATLGVEAAQDFLVSIAQFI